MVLKEIKFKEYPICYCSFCNGAGLTRHNDLSDDIGIVCEHCGGTGFLRDFMIDDYYSFY